MDEEQEYPDNQVPGPEEYGPNKEEYVPQIEPEVYPQLEPENGPSTASKLLLLIGLIALIILGIIIPLRLTPGGLHSISGTVSKWFGGVSPATQETKNNSPVAVAIPLATTTKSIATTTKSIATTTKEKTVILIPTETTTKITLGTTTATLHQATSTSNQVVVPKQTKKEIALAPTRADLKIVILSIGTLDDYGIFRPTQMLAPGSRAAVRFQVTNIGGTNSGLWSFNALLPSWERHVYSTENIKNIPPQKSTLFTLGFDNLDAKYGNLVSITLDGDINTTNNTAVVAIPTFGY